MTDSERVVAIRQALKEHGYNNRKVGVRYDGYAIWLTIKDLAIDIKEIEQLAKGYESYERDLKRRKHFCVCKLCLRPNGLNASAGVEHISPSPHNKLAS